MKSPKIHKQYFKVYPLAKNKVQYLDIDSLNFGNPTTKANREKIKKEIEEKGIIPIIVDGLTVLDGNHRIAVVQEMGYKKIPVINEKDAYVQNQ